MQLLSNIFKKAITWQQAGKKTAMATLISSKGASPLEVGARMLISDQMDMLGAVSRGCVESAVVEIAQDVIRTGKAISKHFGIKDEAAWEVGLTCGGEIEVFIQPFFNDATGSQFFDDMTAFIKQNQTYTLLQIINSKEIEASFILDDSERLLSDTPLPDKLRKEIGNILNSESSGLLQLNDGKRLGTVFVERFQSANRLILIGGVELSITLARLSKLFNFQVIVIDPRTVFANKKRFPEANRIINRWPQESLPDLPLGRRDHVAVVSHDEKLDVPALDVCLQSEAGYIGLLGSKKTIQNRFDALKELGWDESALQRIHAPIGLEIGSKSTEEIALSVMAEIVQVKNEIAI